MAANDGPKLQPIAQAFTPEVFADLARRALVISESLETRQPNRFAEVFPDVMPHWHVATVMPGRERTAAEDLSDRRFGVYLPESEHTEIRRGRKVDFKRLMLPGYVLVFVWDIDRHMERIRACEGVRGMLFVDGRVAIIPDRLVDRIRVVENRERPLKAMVEVVKHKKRWRQSQKTLEERNIGDNDILSVSSYSPFAEALRQESETERLSAFHKAIGLAA